MSKQLTIERVKVWLSFAPAAFVAAFGTFVPLMTFAAEGDEAREAADSASASSRESVSGAYVGYATTPTLAHETRVCSFRVPLCIHAAGTSRQRTILNVLGASERAWEALTGALRLPAPDVDVDDLRYHLYLVEGASERGVTRVAARDVRSRVDRAHAFTVLDAAIHEGCELDALVSRELARAVLFRVSPATTEGIARAQTTYLAALLAPCAVGPATDSARAFQTQPNRAVCDARAEEEGSAASDELANGPRARAFSEGASLFWSRIDRAFARTPFAIVMASWALSPTMTPVAAMRWEGEPDAFDVLRVSFQNALSTGSTLDDLLLDTAVARASRDEVSPVTLDWDIAWPASPKRLAPRAPVFPTGSSYVKIRREGAAVGARLRVEITWEEHALFRWTLVKLDADGRELGRVGIKAPNRATEAQMTLADLGGVDSLLLVGTNVGDPTYRFDPDDDVWEPHGWLVTLASE